MLRVKLFIYLLIVCTSCVLYARADVFHSYEVGSPFIKNYPPREYKGFSQNWAIVQDDRGVIFVANGDGVLEYDGVNWRLIRIPNNYTVTSLAIDTGGVILVGSINEFGFLAPDKRGLHRYHSLSEQMGEAAIDFGFINRIVINENNGIFAATDNGVYQLTLTADRVSLNKQENTDNLFFIDSKLYFTDSDSGIFVSHKDSLMPVVGGTFFKNKNINTILEYDSKRLLVSTANHGMFLMDKVKDDNINQSLNIEIFQTHIDLFLEKNRFNHAINLSNGFFAFASARNGTVVIDKKGQVVQILNKSAGIYNDTHYYIFQDAEDAIWLALDNGIAKAEINAPLTFWDDATGLKGSVLTITRFEDKLYAGAWQGVFYLDTELPLNKFPEAYQFEPVFFKPLEGITNTVWDFLVIKDEDVSPVMLMSTSDGIFSLQDGSLNLIYEGVSNRLYRLKEPDNYILAGTDNGALAIEIVKEDGQAVFIPRHRVHGTADRVISIGQTEGGSIWLGTQYRGLTFLKKNKKKNDTLHFQYTAKHIRTYNGQPLGGSIFISEFRDMLLFSCENGLFKLSDTKMSFAPLCRTINNIIANKANISIFQETHNGNLLLQYTLINKGEKIIAEVVFDNDNYEIITYPYKPIPQAEIWTAFSEDNNILWLGGDEGLYRLNKNIDYFYDRPFKTLIRNVQLGSDSIYFGGNTCHLNATFFSCINEDIATEERNDIHYKYNSVIFDFAALFFYDESENMYSYQLIGFDEKPSEWSSQTRKEYTNLPSGSYRFVVYAKNIFGKVSNEVSFEFVILPPWYHTTWAYFLYLLLIGCAIYLIIKYSNKKLIESKLRLEEFVSERTAEIIRQKKELEQEKEKSDRLLLNILPYKIAEELKEKGHAKAKYYEKVSVMFADFANFTQIAEQMEPEELIKQLNKCFIFFDEVCVRNNIEKIKTVGDSYMCAGGIPIKNESNPVDIVLAALEIVQFMNKLHEKAALQKWQLRIGINTGEIITGVVGKKKFAYDIWGDTVNIASRMESSGAPEKINISGATYQYVKDFFECTYRGKVKAKHKGETDMYFVERLKPEFSNDKKGMIPNNLFKVEYNKLIAS